MDCTYMLCMCMAIDEMREARNRVSMFFFIRSIIISCGIRMCGCTKYPLWNTHGSCISWFNIIILGRPILEEHCKRCVLTEGYQIYNKPIEGIHRSHGCCFNRNKFNSLCSQIFPFLCYNIICTAQKHFIYIIIIYLHILINDDLAFDSETFCAHTCIYINQN